MKSDNKKDKQEFKYVSEEKVQEVYQNQIFEETFQETDWNRDYPPQKNFRDINKPFKKFSILKRVPLKTKSTS